jgi:hypothetical protein
MRSVQSVTAAAAALAAAAAIPATAIAAPAAPSGFTITTFASAPSTTPATSGPDDITVLDGHVYVGWQNGVGTKGEPNPKTGQATSTVAEYSRTGKLLASWSLAGKVDGLGADPAAHTVIATVNEDGKSSLYTITHGKIRHYHYSPSPDSKTTGGVFTGGGTDAVAVWNGHIVLTASAPTPHNATAAFEVVLHPASGVAALTKTFADNARARDALTGKKVQLALTDPDSSAVVPSGVRKFGGDFVLAAQADQQLVFAQNLGMHAQKLTRLPLTMGGQSAGIDDLRWAESKHGTLIVVDNSGTVYAVTGNFAAGQAFGSLDTVGKSADNTQVVRLNVKTGELTPFLTGLTKAKGLAWLP